MSVNRIRLFFQAGKSAFLEGPFRAFYPTKAESLSTVSLLWPGSRRHTKVKPRSHQGHTKDGTYFIFISEQATQNGDF